MSPKGESRTSISENHAFRFDCERYRFTRGRIVKQAAFTLAEVLITLGIIGVVAALTLPTLIQNYKEKQTVTALKKFYSVASQAFEMARNEYGDPDNWVNVTDLSVPAVEASNTFADKIKPYFNITRDCGLSGQKNCFPDVHYKSISGIAGSYLNDENNAHSKFVLNSGESVAIILNDNECKYFEKANITNGTKNICGGINVDINGFKGPNVFGRDLFLFYVTKTGIVPAGGASDNSTYSFANKCKRNGTESNTSTRCTAWVIFNENMDYLHCDDLSWNGKTKCK